MVKKKGVTPRTDAEAMQAMHERSVVRSNKHEDMLPEQMLEQLEKLRHGMPLDDWRFMKSIVQEKYKAAKKAEAEEKAALEAEIKRIEEMVAHHLRSFKNLIIDEVE